MRRTVAARLHLVPRFRQVLRVPHRGLGWPLWVDAASFNLDDHIRVAQTDEAHLLDAVEQLRRSFNQPIGPTRTFVEVRGSLETTKKVAHAHNATVNDVLMAAIAGGLCDLLRGRSERIEGVSLRAVVPVSLHGWQPGLARGNVEGPCSSRCRWACLILLPVSG